MKLAGSFNSTKTSYMPEDQGNFDFLYHDCHRPGCFTSPSLLFVLVLTFSEARALSNQWCTHKLISNTCRSFPLPHLFSPVSSFCCQLITLWSLLWVLALLLPACYFYLFIVRRTQRQEVCNKAIFLTAIRHIIGIL